ncbi:MAG: hypothetical protein QGG40_08835 [Myxococcota bacterium]|nr:hypothetical protein [Myxococcota bacterium]
MAIKPEKPDMSAILGVEEPKQGPKKPKERKSPGRKRPGKNQKAEKGHTNWTLVGVGGVIVMVGGLFIAMTVKPSTGSSISDSDISSATLMDSAELCALLDAGDTDGLHGSVLKVTGEVHSTQAQANSVQQTATVLLRGSRVKACIRARLEAHTEAFDALSEGSQATIVGRWVKGKDMLWWSQVVPPSAGAL